MLNLGEIITLSNGKKYVVVSSINYFNDNYVYLSEFYKNENIKICLVKNNEVTEVLDKDLIDELEKLFVDNISE